jgi:hypothetical protein
VGFSEGFFGQAVKLGDDQLADDLDWPGQQAFFSSGGKTEGQCQKKNDTGHHQHFQIDGDGVAGQRNDQLVNFTQTIHGALPL